ncbi:unnamed protein product [Cuscuta epithymum]|uniref:Reverse transcriptase zinc-binding domain-containing protein n=1 Tax=Cuscuta epithymum TaxID=186058 RepID=A0AAV0F0D3_9ASTE|nr:unnamed protein product [Cuscuta epithymum]
MSLRDRRLIQQISLSYRQVPDRLMWNSKKDDHFCVRSCYRKLTGEVSARGWIGWTQMWKWSIPPKIKTFFWQVCLGFLPTLCALRSRRVNCPWICGLCKGAEESSLHLSAQCPTAVEVGRILGRK